MPWQDIVIAIGQWIFLFALFPSILSKDKPALTTSISTGIVLMVFTITYVLLSFWASAISTFLVSAGWFTLAIQKYMANRKS